MILRGAIDTDEGACVLLGGGALALLSLAQAIRDADPTEIAVEPLPDMTNLMPLRAIVIREDAGAVRVELRDDCAILSGGEDEREIVAYRVLEFLYYGDLSEPGMHAHIDAEDGALAAGSCNIMLLGDVPDVEAGGGEPHFHIGPVGPIPLKDDAARSDRS